MNRTGGRILFLILSWMLIFQCRIIFAEQAAPETSDDEPEEEITVIEKRQPSPSLPQLPGSGQIRDWYAPDNKTLIIDAGARGKFKATFMRSCTGIRFTDSIGFSTMGPFELDRSTKIILPNGEYCFFKELRAYSKEEEERDKLQRQKKTIN